MIFNRYAKQKLIKFSDNELVLHYKNTKDVHVISILYERYSHLILGVCLKYLKQHEQAEDTTIAIFTDLPNKLERHNIQHIKSWLYQVSKNECLQLLRKKRFEILYDESEMDWSEIDEPQILEEHEKKLTQVELALSQLKEEQRKCIELFYYQQKRYEEIGMELGISINTVKSAIQNGKRNLKIWIENHE